MPIPHTPQQNNWIHRVAEDEFVALLREKEPYIQPLVGGGGAGKTSLLRRLFAHCEANNIPALYIDLPRLNVATALDMWLRLEAVHVPALEVKRKQLHSRYESLSAMLQTYGDNASSAAALLQQQVDEDYGLVVDALKGAGKAVYEFWQRAENQQHKTLLTQPEEQLIRALAEDFEQGGVVLIDTLEQAMQQPLATRLQFQADGELKTPAAESAQPLPWLDYCAGLAHFLLDWPVILTLAGRPPAVRELGHMPPHYFTPTWELPAFTAAEIEQYLEASLPRHIRSPEPEDIQRLQQLTVGNPFLLERVLRLMVDWQPIWDWQAEQWQPLLDNYQRDDRHGLLLYVTQRLLTHVLPNDRVFWRLALPRQSVHREMAALLFPAEELGEMAGLVRLRVYEEKGLVYRQQDPDVYFLHDETRAALEAWARREGVWLNAVSAEIHGRLAEWVKEKTDWENLAAKLEKNWVRKNDQLLAEFGNPLLLEGAYHSIMADAGFEERYTGYGREAFWLRLANSVSLTNADKMRIASSLPNLSLFQIENLTQVFSAEKSTFGSMFSPAAQKWLETKSLAGQLPENWGQNEAFLTEALKLFPTEATFLGSFAVFMETIRQDYDRAEALYQQAIDADPKHARNLGNFAYFLWQVRQDYDRAEALFQQAIDADPNHAHYLGNFAYFLWQVRQDYDRAEALFQQAIDADPKHANNLGNFANFMKNIRQDYDRAEALFQQAIDADPNHAHYLGNFAYFLWQVRQDYDRAEALYQQAIDADPNSAHNLGAFAIFQHCERKDYAQAITFYQRALEAGSKDPNIYANYAQLKLITGDTSHGKQLLEQAFAHKPEDPAAKLELWFYCLAHFPNDYPQAETEILRLLDSGARSTGWDLSGNIAQAERDGHPNLERLKELAARITA